MTERLTYSIYRIVSVGLFSSHQLTFSFLLCASIMRANAQQQHQQGAPSPVPSLPPTAAAAKEEGEKGAKVTQAKVAAAEEEEEDGGGKKDGDEEVSVQVAFLGVLLRHRKP